MTDARKCFIDLKYDMLIKSSISRASHKDLLYHSPLAELLHLLLGYVMRFHYSRTSISFPSSLQLPRLLGHLVKQS